MMTLKSRILVFTAVAVALVGAAMIVQSRPAHAQTPPQPYTIATDVNPLAWQAIDRAMRVAPPLPCAPTFYVEPTPGKSGFASSDCSIHLDPSDFRDDNALWYADYATRHEVAHIATMSHGHDPLFRAVLAAMLRPLHVVEQYGPTGEYPQRILRRGRCVYGC